MTLKTYRENQQMLEEHVIAAAQSPTGRGGEDAQGRGLDEPHRQLREVVRNLRAGKPGDGQPYRDHRVQCADSIHNAISPKAPFLVSDPYLRT